MTEQIELIQPEAEIVDIKNLGALESERIRFMAMTGNVTVEAKEVIATIKDAKSCDDAVAWCAARKETIQVIQGSLTWRVKKILFDKWSSFNKQFNQYIDPTEKAIKDVMVAVKRKKDEMQEKARQKEELKNAKLLEKAENKKHQEVQKLVDEGKINVAKVVAQKPIQHAPVSIQMPKIKGAIWKKRYIVKIDDIGALLKYVAKKPQYYSLIDQEVLQSRLERLAGTLNGNMKEFEGVTCFETESAAIVGGSKNG